jgi:hypothetical protein
MTKYVVTYYMIQNNSEKTNLYKYIIHADSMLHALEIFIRACHIGKITSIERIEKF